MLDEYESEDIEQLENDCRKWEQLFYLACHDRDAWQQECEKLDMVCQRQNAIIKELRGYERAVVIDTKFTEGQLEENQCSLGYGLTISEVPISSEAEQTTEGSRPATRNEGQDSGAAQANRRSGGDSEGLC